MTDLEFDSIVDKIFKGYQNHPILFTGLPKVDEKNIQLKVTRVLEVLEKIKTTADSGASFEFFKEFDYEDVDDLIARLQKKYTEKAFQDSK